MANKPPKTVRDSGIHCNAAKDIQGHQISASQDNEELLDKVIFLMAAIDRASGCLKRNEPELALLILEGTKGWDYLEKHYA